MRPIIAIKLSSSASAWEVVGPAHHPVLPRTSFSHSGDPVGGFSQFVCPSIRSCFSVISNGIIDNHLCENHYKFPLSFLLEPRLSKFNILVRNSSQSENRIYPTQIKNLRIFPINVWGEVKHISEKLNKKNNSQTNLQPV